jgi:DNA-directed RNA polymerase subunit RPC12/RpoP
MIKFHCPNCNKKFGVPDDYAGRRVRCNACSQHTIVPKPVTEIVILPLATDRTADAKHPVASKQHEDGSQTDEKSNPASVSVPDKPVETTSRLRELQHQSQLPFQFEELKLSPEEDLPPMDPNLEALRQASRMRTQRSDDSAKTEKFSTKEVIPSPGWYWPFLFPIRGSAMGMIGVFILSKIIVSFLSILPLIGLIAIGLSILVQAYIYWYLYLCVQTAAEGKIRSPDLLQEDEGDYLGMIWRMIRMILAVFFCMAPAIIYFLWNNAGMFKDTHTEKAGIDGIFWSMFAAGLFFMPMTLLSIVMHDSIGGLNPFLIISAVIRTLLKYLVLVICFSIPLGMTFVVNMFSGRLGFWFALPAEVLSYYLAFVGAAILGRFFYRNEKQLNWEV